MTQQDRLHEAMRLHTAGQFDKAWTSYQHLLAEDPVNSDVTHLMGVLAGQVGNLMESARLIGEAIKLRPGIPDYYKNLGITWQRLENRARAGEAFIDQGNALADLNRPEEAIAAFAQAIKVDPKNEHAVNNLAHTLSRLGRHAEARDTLLRALAPDPALPPDLAHWQGKALPDGFLKQLPSLHLNLGNALQGLGDYEGALVAFERTLELNPDSSEAHQNRAMVLLTLGLYTEGWTEFEWRWQHKNYIRIRPEEQEFWNGASPQALGGPLLVLHEQGHGDAIQFSRFVPLLAEQGYDVQLEVKPELMTLFADSFGDSRIQLLPTPEIPGEHPGVTHAGRVGIMSLPRILGVDVGSIPADTPYLKADPARAEQWAERFAGETQKPRVGLVWAGNPNHPRNLERSVPPPLLHALLDRESLAFYSLQKGPAAAYRFAGKAIVSLDQDLQDFADTAAAIANLDLVIAADTGVAHLAAALGRPVWLLVTHVPDWRWLLDREDSPWYPSARLFRQPTPGEWASVIAAVGKALDEFIEGKPI